jgi:hypothetical protein
MIVLALKFLHLNYKDGRFGPQTFAYDSNSSLAYSQIPFLPFSYALLAASWWGTRCSLCSSLSLSSPRRQAPPVWRPAALPNPPHWHLLLRWRAQILGATATEAGHGWGMGALGEGGARPLLHLRGGRPTALIRQQRAVRRDRRRVIRVFGYRWGMNLSRMRKFEG